MQVNIGVSNKIKIPKHDIGDNILYFDHVKGKFDYGDVIQIQVIKTEQYETVAYAVNTSENITLPCVPEELTFSSKHEAECWLDNVKSQLDMV